MLQSTERDDHHYWQDPDETKAIRNVQYDEALCCFDHPVQQHRYRKAVEAYDAVVLARSRSLVLWISALPMVVKTAIVLGTIATSTLPSFGEGHIVEYATKSYSVASAWIRLLEVK